jgi:hypothetical protein
MLQKSFSFVCHSGLDPESSVSELDSCLRGNDGLRNSVKKCLPHYNRVVGWFPSERAEAGKGRLPPLFLYSGR